MGEIIPYLSRKANEKMEIIRHDEDSVELSTVMREEEVKKLSERENHQSWERNRILSKNMTFRTNSSQRVYNHMGFTTILHIVFQIISHKDRLS